MIKPNEPVDVVFKFVNCIACSLMIFFCHLNMVNCHCFTPFPWILLFMKEKPEPQANEIEKSQATRVYSLFQVKQIKICIC